MTFRVWLNCERKLQTAGRRRARIYGYIYTLFLCILCNRQPVTFAIEDWSFIKINWRMRRLYVPLYYLCITLNCSLTTSKGQCYHFYTKKNTFDFITSHWNRNPRCLEILVLLWCIEHVFSFFLFHTIIYVVFRCIDMNLTLYSN